MKVKNILIIAKKELKSYFDNPTAYVILIAFLLLWYFLFFRNAFLVGEASLRGLFNLLPWLFLLLIPALTMGSISQEKREGTLEFLLTRPLRDRELIIGKFLGGLLFAAIALLFVFPLAWSFSQYGNFDWGVFLGQYLAGIFMAAVLISLGLFISSIFSSQVSALLVAVLASFFMVIAGFEIVTSRLSLTVAPIFEKLSVASHFNSMSRGVIDFRDAWYFLSATACFLGLAYLRIVKRRFGKNKKGYQNYRIGITLFIGIVILTNVISGRLPGRIDLTQNDIYTLSDQTVKTLEGLDDIVNVDFFASSQLPAQLQPVLRDTEDLLGDFKAFSRGNIVLNRKDPGGDKKIAEEAQLLGIREIRFNVISQEELQVKNGYLGIAVSYGGSSEAIPYVEDTNDLEYQLISFIKKLTIKEKKKIGFISGHGEKSVSRDLSLLKKELGKQYEVIDIASAGGAAAGESEPKKEESKKLSIPEDISAIMLAGPSQEINNQEREEIVKFIKSGKSAMFLVDAVTVTPQLMSATENKNSLADFIKNEYGVVVNSDMVYDLRSNEIVNFGNFLLPYPFWIKTVKAGISPITEKIDSVNFPWASSISVDEKTAAEKGFSTDNLLETTKYGGIQTGTLSIDPDQTFSNEGLKAVLVAVSLEKKEEAGKKTRLIIAGDSDFITDQFMANSTGNFAFAVESFGWLVQEESLAEIKVKSKEERKLLFDNQAQANKLKFGNMAVALIIPLAYGTFRIMRRKKKQSQPYGY